MTTPDRQPVDLRARPCRWSYANSMSFAFCETHGDYHRTFLTPPSVCPTAQRALAYIAQRDEDGGR